MIQRQHTHKPGTFPTCKDCGHEPKHFVASGCSSKDPIRIGERIAERHMLECFCTKTGSRTRLHADFAAASIEWRDTFSIAALQFTRRRQRAA